MPYSKTCAAVVLVLLPACFAMKDFPEMSHVRTRTAPEDQAKAAKDLMTRLVGDRASDFTVTVNQTLGPQGKDTYRLTSVAGGKIQIEGTSGVAVSMGFYYYLKYYCNGQRTWAGQQTELPTTLPVLSQPVVITTLDRFRHYINVCTHSYSYPWWHFEQWEKEIDWMALHGINMPMAMTGQEAIFNRVYLSLGLTQPEIDDFFGGPAYLAWSRMGNTQGWGGPTTAYWRDTKMALQHKILDRMRSLGMTPILAGFGGHVPRNVSRVFPNASITASAGWQGFGNMTGVSLVDPNDPLFVKIGSMYVKEMTKEFGTDHLYNADTFNEMPPVGKTAAFIGNSSLAVYNAMIAADPQAVWVMQGWIFLQSFWTTQNARYLLDPVPKGRLIVLDLAAELTPGYIRMESFFGHAWVWCMFANNGGSMELYGKMDSYNKGPSEGRNFANSSMVGIGMTMEGINQNEVNYEFFIENAWVPKPRNVSDWVLRFVRQRYGESNDFANQAWMKLMGPNSVYNASGRISDSNDVFLTKRPYLRGSNSQWFNASHMFSAWELMVNASQSSANLSHNPLFRYDLVDFTRNSIQTLLPQVKAPVVDAFNQINLTQLQSSGAALSGLLADLDRLLGSNDRFLLGTWLEEAKTWANTTQERAHIEYNARNQITVWGPTEQIMDYATKQWSGLVEDYIKARFDFFTNWLINLVKSKQGWNYAAYSNAIKTQVELAFPHQTKTYPTTPIGDSVAIAQELCDKYKPQLDLEYFDDKFRLYQLRQRKLQEAGEGQRSSWLSRKYAGYNQDYVYDERAR